MMNDEVDKQYTRRNNGEQKGEMGIVIVVKRGNI